MGLEEKVTALAKKQWGVFSRSQALDAGASKSGITRRLKNRDWVEVERGVYGFRGGVPSWHRKVCAATLSLGLPAMASHRTAAQLWGLDQATEDSALIEVVAPRSVKAVLRTAKVHRTRAALPEPVVRDRINTTPLAHTVIDLSDVVSEEWLFIAFDSARRQFKKFVAELELILPTHRGRRRADRLVWMVERSKKNPATESGLEGKVAYALHKSPLPQPTLQQVMKEPDGTFIARVDFAWLRERVIVQCDSKKYHLTPEAFEKDLRQRRKLESLGWRVIHITWAMLATNEWLLDVTRLITAQQAALG